ncbi:M48 family metallopeptidase [Tunturibacter empetritectus]|uniref:Zn-dependent protease with chaperone function n=1 Tax=Tunturiibacter lichenicola TaxID=2051959 RepID=A0A7W8JAZ0_9BACT|nr:M48 family metallopeptidase [Edaphobacter lichenicola]MBB5344564.1 Zn-dependent protease with chaperone function [Edaphobacter lichenicola]
MNVRAALLLLISFFVITIPSAKALGTTPTEAQALREAAQNHTAYTLPPDKLKLAKELFRDRTALHLLGEGWEILQLILLLALGVPSRLRDLAERVTKSRWGQSFVFVFLFLLLTALLNAPLRLYGHHVSLAYGLSVQRWGSWFADLGKSFLLEWLVASILVMVLFWVIRWSPKRWWFWFWIPTMVAVLFGVFLSPILVDPLFNKFEPLQQRNPALVAQLERVVARSGVTLPPDKMFFMRASSKVTSMNAYVTGFGPSKRLVLWDTTIAAATPDELAGVFGHELGHYALHHIVQGVLFSAVLLLVGFFAGQRMTWWLLARYGSRWKIRSQNDWACLAVLVLVLNVLNFFAEPIENSFSRSIEHAADVYGQEAIHGIVSDPQTTTQQGFQKLGENSLDDPTPHPFIDFWSDGHPSTASRAAFALAYDPWTAGQHPKYFQP